MTGVGGGGKPEIKMDPMTIIFIAHCVLQLRDDTYSFNLLNGPMKLEGRRLKIPEHLLCAGSCLAFSEELSFC